MGSWCVEHLCFLSELRSTMGMLDLCTSIEVQDACEAAHQTLLFSLYLPKNLPLGLFQPVPAFSGHFLPVPLRLLTT